jgi:PKD repeat protein
MNQRSCVLTLVALTTLAFVACGEGRLPVSSTSTESSYTTSATGSSLTATFDYVPVTSSAFTGSDATKSGTTYDTFRFTAKVKGGVPPYSFKWDFGDGDTAAGNPVTHYFYRSGSYNVKLTVDDSAGASTGEESPEVELEITATPFTMECDASPTKGAAPLTVRFRAWPDGNEGPIEWYWDFGDGGTSSERVVEHTYDGIKHLSPGDDSPTCAPTPEPKPEGPVTYLAVVTATEMQGNHRSVSCKQKITVN